MSPFEFYKSVTMKGDLFESEVVRKNYIPFIVNRSLSYFPNGVMPANEMNLHANLPIEWQYRYLYRKVPKGKMFAKWHKTNPIENINIVQDYFQCNKKRASELLDFIDENTLEEMRNELYVGGTSLKSGKK